MVVPATYQLSPQSGGNSAYLITCDPIGSTENRLIVQGELVGTQAINNQIITSNPQESNALIITTLFLVLGLIFTFLYPKENRAYILATVLIVFAILLFFCIHPIPSGLIYDKIIFLNGGI